MRLMAGRMLSDRAAMTGCNSTLPGGDPLNDGHNILVNERARTRLGFTPQEAVGKTILLDQQSCARSWASRRRQSSTARASPSSPPSIRLSAELADAVLDPPAPGHGAADPGLHRPDLARLLADRRASSATSWTTSFDKLYQADERQGAMFGIFVGDRHLHRLPGPVRAGRLHRRPAHQGDRHPQGVRRAHPRCRAAAACGNSPFPC